jgi:hypothetical protein
MDVSIQIGNTDNCLTQQEWSEFCRRLREICETAGKVHFSGGASTDAPWQNYCLCLSTELPECLASDVMALRRTYRQDSVAWLQGDAMFI